MWDLYTEPGNEGLIGNALPLLQEVFGWAREVAPAQPLRGDEYLARTTDSRFETHLPLFRQAGIGCVNWGLVAGKTQTHFPGAQRRGHPNPRSGTTTSSGPTGAHMTKPRCS